MIREFEGVVIATRPTSAPERRYALRIGENEYWDAFPQGSPDFWSNFIDHSDDPNAVLVFDKQRKKAWLKAEKPIKKGEEIFLRYDSYFPANPRFGPAVGRPLR